MPPASLWSVPRISVEDILFNTLLLRSNKDLDEIARALLNDKIDPSITGEFEARAKLQAWTAKTAAALANHYAVRWTESCPGVSWC